MMTRIEIVSALTVVAVVLSGCGSAPADVGLDEAKSVPATPRNLYDQATTCARILKRHEVVRSVGLKDGSIRWNCGDVPGVTETDRGQEYCEYHALSGGKHVNRIDDAAATTPLRCVFTGVFTGNRKGETLATSMARAENLGVAAESGALMEMQKGFNARGAAVKLIDDCERNAGRAQPVEEARMAACQQEIAKGNAYAATLENICDDGDLSDGAVWGRVSAMGATILASGDEGYDAQRDLIACLATKRAQGVSWRNSDPMICGRVTRAVAECSCIYDPVPDAVDGFSFTGWTNDRLPAGCRYASVGGTEYRQLVICDVSDGERSDIALRTDWSGDLDEFCHDRFGTELVLTAPIRALEKPGSCKAGAGFCTNYSGK